MTPDEHRRAALARRGLHEDAQWARKAGMSAVEWEERVAEQAPDAAALVGQRTLDAIVRLVWLARSRR